MNVWMRRQQNRLRYRLRMFRIHKFILFFTLFMLLLLVSTTLYYAKMRPQIREMAVDRSTQILQREINSAITQSIQKQGVTQDNLVVIDKNESGAITAIRANSVLMNLVKTGVSDAVLEAIEEMDTADISIPLGNITGNDFLSGRGPKLSILAVPYGTCLVDFESTFLQAGINQTKFQINMTVTTKIAFLLPLGSGTAYADIKSGFPIGETIIVGQVPDVYANLGGNLIPPDSAKLPN